MDNDTPTSILQIIDEFELTGRRATQIAELLAQLQDLGVEIERVGQASVMLDFPG